MPITTIPSLDRKLWGLKRQEVVVVGARSSHGKSALMNQVAWDLAVNGKKVLYLSLEMDVPALQERLFCNIAKVDNMTLIKGGFSRDPRIRQRWDEFETLVSSRYLEYCDYIGKTWQDIDQLLNTLHDKPDAIILDHINEVRAPSSKERRQIIDDYLENFRHIIVKNKIVGILGSQINRSGQAERNKEPQLHQLKETGKLEELADVVLLLYWPHKDNEKNPVNKYKFIVAKNRNGMTGYVHANFEPQYYRFSDWEGEDEETEYARKRKELDKELGWTD